MAAQFVANLIRLKEEGVRPDRDLILALTADEEGGNFNGVDWLLKNHRPLIDAEFSINEGGGGTMRGGKYLDERGSGQREGVSRTSASRSRTPAATARCRSRTTRSITSPKASRAWRSSSSRWS